MTILAASNQLLEWFRNNDCFNLEQHFKQIKLISDDIDSDKAAVLGALIELDKANLVRRVEQKSKTAAKENWVLIRPLNHISQTLTLSAETCLTISTILNSYELSSGDKMAQYDAKNLQDKDVGNALTILSRLIEVNMPKNVNIDPKIKNN